MEKMDKEVKEAVKELLEKIPEDTLREAVGGLKPSFQNALIAFGVIVGLGVLGYGGYRAGKKIWGKNNKQETSAETPSAGNPPAETTSSKNGEVGHGNKDFYSGKGTKEDPIIIND